MKISVDHGFLFVHIPRTAGSSIEGVLSPLCIEERKTYPKKALSKLGLTRRWTDHDYRIHLPLADAERRIPKDVFDALLKFAVVRNPYDWLVSRYHHRRQRAEKGGRSRTSRHPEGFSAFLRWAALRIGRRPEATQLGMLATANHSVGADRLLRFETLERDWACLIEDLGIHDLGVQAALPRWNRSTHDAWRAHYDDEDTRFVSKHWAEDLDVLEYAFVEPAEEGARRE